MVDALARTQPHLLDGDAKQISIHPFYIPASSARGNPPSHLRTDVSEDVVVAVIQVNCDPGSFLGLLCRGLGLLRVRFRLGF